MDLTDDAQRAERRDQIDNLLARLQHHGTLTVAETARLRDHINNEIRLADEQPPVDIAAADNPTPLRWGLGDVLWGDDDTVTVLLSGPGGEPYWLELDQERAAVLREDLAGPDTEETHDDSAGLENGHGDTAIRLDDGSTHTHTAITNAGEACLMHACRAAQEETRLRQEQYSQAAALDHLADEIRDLADDGQIPATAAARLRELIAAAAQKGGRQ
jgi:hypothetical protein